MRKDSIDSCLSESRLRVICSKAVRVWAGGVEIMMPSGLDLEKADRRV